ncbi:MAG TPA: hypothetical protein VD948_05330, partial [Rhodothermales bacterium]|nr:hypothetical protein [Rhodothermales bacterium]
MRSVNVVIGSVAATVVLSAPVMSMLGDQGVRIIGAIAAIVLVLDGVIPVLMGEETSERLGEYSMYIHSYSNMILNTLADDSLAVNIKR